MKKEIKGFLPVEAEELSSALGGGRYDQTDPEMMETRSPPAEAAMAKPQVADPVIPKTTLPVFTEQANGDASSASSGYGPKGRFNEIDYADVNLGTLQESNDTASVPAKASTARNDPGKPASIPQANTAKAATAPLGFFAIAANWFQRYFQSPAAQKIEKSSPVPVSAPKKEDTPQFPSNARHGGIQTVSKEFFQNGKTDEKGTITKFKENDQDNFTINKIGKSKETIYESGCLITAVTRIVNAISGSKRDPGQMETIAENKMLFDPSDRAALTSIEKLVEAGTNKDVKYSRIDGNEAQLIAKIKERTRSAEASFMIAHLSNGHFVNVNGIDPSGNPIIADTSIKNISWASMRQSGLRISDLRLVSL